MLPQAAATHLCHPECMSHHHMPSCFLVFRHHINPVLRRSYHINGFESPLLRVVRGTEYTFNVMVRLFRRIVCITCLFC